MLTAINLNHQLGVWTIKVHDIVTNDSLAIKPAIFDLSLSELQPEKGFGLRQVMAQLPGKFLEVLIVREHLIIPP
jgi:hypothetical protein